MTGSERFAPICRNRAPSDLPTGARHGFAARVRRSDLPTGSARARNGSPETRHNRPPLRSCAPHGSRPSRPRPAPVPFPYAVAGNLSGKSSPPMRRAGQPRRQVRQGFAVRAIAATIRRPCADGRQETAPTGSAGVCGLAISPPMSATVRGKSAERFAAIGTATARPVAFLCAVAGDLPQGFAAHEPTGDRQPRRQVRDRGKGCGSER